MLIFKSSQLVLTFGTWLSLLLGDIAPYRKKKTEKNCLNARPKMTSDKFDDELLVARKINNENKMKNGYTLIYSI